MTQNGPRPPSPSLHPELAETLLESLTQWTVTASVPLAHAFMELGDDQARDAFDRMALDNPVSAGLLEDRYLADTPDLDALAELPDGTLGRAFEEYIRINELDVTKLRESAFIEAHQRRGDDSLGRPLGRPPRRAESRPRPLTPPRGHLTTVRSTRRSEG